MVAVLRETAVSRERGLLTNRLQEHQQYDIIRKEGGGEMQLKYHMVIIKDLVSENHFPRKLERLLDLSLYV